MGRVSVSEETNPKPWRDDGHETEKVVGVWYDNTPEPAWVVADEELNPDGSTDYTTTVKAFGANKRWPGNSRGAAAKRGVRVAIQ